jgi:uncharacterized membrane protein YfcA
VISLTDSVALVAAGTLAGLVGSAGGITSLISYPALLAIGLAGHSANIANGVALVACLPGSFLGSRPELSGQGPWLARWIGVAALGAAAGAVLLLCTPSHLFTRVVPFLVAIGSLALLLEPRFTARRRRHPHNENTVALTIGLLALSLYNGYFGAGSGVMTLTLILVFVDGHLPRANALKNMIIGVASLVGATLFVIFASVQWSAALPLALGMLAGSRVGPTVARRMPQNILRWLIVLFGMTLAVDLWLNPGA